MILPLKRNGTDTTRRDLGRCSNSRALKKRKRNNRHGSQMTYENWPVTNGISICHWSLLKAVRYRACASPVNSHMSFWNCPFVAIQCTRSWPGSSRHGPESPREYDETRRVGERNTPGSIAGRVRCGFAREPVRWHPVLEHKVCGHR